MKKLLINIATLFEVGKFPLAPGTLASLITTVVFFLFNFFLEPSLRGQIAAIVIIYLLGIPASSAAEKHFKTKDPSFCVIDEVAGQMIALLFLPALFTKTSIFHYIGGFLLFRLFDIFKPFPVNIADKKLKGGFGVMTDDILAGLYALGTLQLLIFLF